MALENWVDKQDGIDDILAEDINSIANAVIETQEEINKIVIDQTYSPESENAQSGIAVAEAVAIEQKRSDNTFANALKGNKSDTAMLLDDASPVTHEMRVKVRSKNLLNFNKDNFVYNASSVEYLENGFVLIANSRRDTYAKLLNFEFKRGVQYTISFDIEIEDNNTNNNAGVLFVSTNDKSWYVGDVLRVPRNSINNGKVKATFTTPLDKDCNVFFSGTNLAPDITGRASFANIQIELGTTATAYTPYVPDLTAVKVTRYGKNLIPLPYIHLPIGTTTLNGIEFTVYEDGSILMNGTATTSFTRYLYSNKQDLLGLRAGDIITGSKWVSDGSQIANFNLTFNYYNIDGTMEQGVINLSSQQNLTTTITEDYVGWGIYIYISSGKTFDNLLFKPQLELGKTATDYEPYVEPTYYTPNADGTVNGITSLYPNTTLMTDTEGVIITCEYNKDINTFSGADVDLTGYVKNTDINQSFDPTSENAQSGKAVAEAVAPKLELLGVYELQNDITYNILEDASNYTKIMLSINKNNGVANDNRIGLMLCNKMTHFVKLTYMQTGITISIFDNFYICETHNGNNVQYQESVVSRSLIEYSGSKWFKMIIYADTLNEADIGKTFSVWGIRK